MKISFGSRAQILFTVFLICCSGAASLAQNASPKFEIQRLDPAFFDCRVLTGRMDIEGKRFFLLSNELKVRAVKAEIQSTDFKTQTTLQNLQNGDLIRATVSPSETPGVLLVESIDFVGLNRLLGRWLTRPPVSTQAIVDFHDFSNMTIFLPGSETHFQYAITPKNASSWRLFITDQSTVQLGELLIRDKTIEIHFFDPRTGQVQKRFFLEKIQSEQNSRSALPDLSIRKAQGY